MAGTSRIDELRKKFDENPRRYFAPLANEYRKIGDFEQAIFICQEFLPQQPGHMSGHIVYGQALFESGRHDEARSVFETALALDPENLIALRHLGDIARARGDNETAGAWYRRVLESDPRNEEIAGILSSLGADAAAQPSSAAPAAGQSGASDGAPAGGPLTMESAINAATGGNEPSAAAAGAVASDPSATAPSESNFDDIAKLFTAATPAPAPAPAHASEPPPAADDSLNLIHEGEDVLGSVQSAAAAHAEHSLLHQDTGGPSAPTVDSPAAPAAEPAPAFNLPFLDGLTSAEPSPAAPAPPASTAATPEPPPRAPVPDADAAFVTETMAELYVKQGHHEQALEVYRQLVRRHPNDAALASRLRQLETKTNRAAAAEPAASAAPPAAVTAAGPTIREFLGSIADYRPGGGGASTAPSPQPKPVATREPPPNEPRSMAPAATVGDSLSTLFAGAERDTSRAAERAADFAPPKAAPPAGDSEAPSLHGRPSTPAATELSLDHVFRHATPTAASAAHSSFSFDQFFSQQAQKDVAAADAEPSSQESAGLSDDIQQFNAWLEGLKKT